MILQERAIIDHRIRRDIIRRKNLVIVPTMTSDKLDFWKEVAERFKQKKQFVQLKDWELPLYKFDKAAVLAYSGGLESSLVSHMWPHLPIFNWSTLIPKLRWTNPIEGGLGIAGAGLGYFTTYMGVEADCGMTLREDMVNYRSGFYWERTPHYTDIWEKYSGGAILTSPLLLFQKDELFDVALREEVTFGSCYKAFPGWCGKCFKCLKMHLIYRSRGASSPIKMKQTQAEILAEHKLKLDLEEFDVLLKKLAHREQRGGLSSEQ